MCTPDMLAKIKSYLPEIATRGEFDAMALRDLMRACGEPVGHTDCTIALTTLFGVGEFPNSSEWICVSVPTESANLVDSTMPKIVRRRVYRRWTAPRVSAAHVSAVDAGLNAQLDNYAAVLKIPRAELIRRILGTVLQ